MKYIGHEIEPNGRIFIIEAGKNGRHRTPIQPNQPLTKYKAEIEADPDFAKYRTAENATAYEELIKPEPVTKEQLQAEMQAEVQRLAIDRIVQREIESDPLLTAMANVQSKIDSGEVSENAGKAIRDEIGKVEK